MRTYARRRSRTSMRTGGICWGANTVPDVNEHLAEETWKLFSRRPLITTWLEINGKPYPEDVRQLLVGIGKQKARCPDKQPEGDLENS